MKPANGQQALARKPLRITVFLSALIILACALASPAQAAPPYKYERVLSERLSESVPGGAFATPVGLTFDGSGNLFVADAHGGSGEGAIDRFDPTEAFIEPQLGVGVLSEGTQGVAVNDETGHVYVGDANAREVFVLSQAGEELSHWTGASREAGPFGGGGLHVAVDNSTSVSKGDVYVMSAREGIGSVDVFEPQNGDKEEGKFLRSLTPPLGTFEFGQADGLAVDQGSGPAAGDVYVADPSNKVVDRFSPTGEFELAIEGPSPTEPFQPVGVGVDDATGDVFVVDRHAKAVDRFSASGVFLQQITGPGAGFKDAKDLAIQQLGPNAGDVYVADSEAHVIDVFALEVPAKPSVSEAAVENVSGDSAYLTGEVNPRGAPSTYRFDYGACATPQSCEASPFDHSIPVPEGEVGAAEDFASHTVGPFHIHGLAVSTTYHYRLVATNSHGQTLGEEHTFTTQPTGGEMQLPDNRLWELVSPPDKRGASIGGIPDLGVAEAAGDGSAVSYLANAPIEPAPAGDAGEVQVLSTHTASGWSSRDIASPHETATGKNTGTAPEYRFFATDFSSAIVQPFGLFNPALSSEASEQTPYVRSLGSCESSCYRPLVSGAPGHNDVPPGMRFGEEASCTPGFAVTIGSVCGPLFLAATGDASHVVLSSEAPLKAGVPRNELYEWSAGSLQLVSVPPANGAGEELPAPTEPGVEPVIGTSKGGESSARRALSADGSRVFWEYKNGTSSALFVRDTRLGKSLQLDSAEPGCGECKSGDARYQIASSDGSRVLFTDTSRLTGDASAKGSDLYECDIVVGAAGKLACGANGPVDLTPAGSGESTQIQGDVVGASEDDGTVYFVANGVLAAGASPGACEFESPDKPTTCSLYVRRGATLRFVATVANGDEHDWSNTPRARSAQVSPDGEWLAFMSERSLTGFDNRDAASGHPDAEVYSYHAATGQLSCASCDPTGARPVGIEAGQLTASNGDETIAPPWPSRDWVAATLPRGMGFKLTGSSTSYPGRHVLNSGRLFFNGLDGLVPQDVNGTWDVYQHEPAGVGDCALGVRGFDPHTGGCIGLISSGTSPEVSAFLDASETGGDVFFLTSTKLSTQDVDSNFDVYDAHECTVGSPCTPPPPVPPPPCSTEASCRPAPTLQPLIFGAPSTATFQGPGNLTAPPTVTKPVKPTRHELLLKALRACHKRYPLSKHRRQACERKARRAHAARATTTQSARGAGISTDQRRGN